MAQIAKKHIRVLLIEDNSDDADLLMLQLERASFEPDSIRVDDANALKAAITHYEWDIILSDFNMPRLNGLQALKIVREVNSEIPFIVVSGAIGEETAVELMRSGAQDFIQKGNGLRLIPVIERELIEAEHRKVRRLAEEAKIRLEKEREVILEQLKEAVKTRDEFISIASHELKTPLTSLNLQTQILERSLEREDFEFAKNKLPHFFSLLHKQLGRLNHLVEDMLDVTRIASGQLVVSYQEINLSDLIREICARLYEQARTLGIVLQVDVPDVIVGAWDSFRMDQVLSNLIANAIKYGRKGSIEIRAKVVNGRVQIEVEDHGPGIEKKDQQRVFDRFERAISASEVSGLGLGLFICKRIVEAHQGRIWVESEPGQGARFIVEVPLHPAGFEQSSDIAKAASY